MALIVAGVNHRTAPIELRERLALPAHEFADALRALVDRTGAREAVALSTCNRTELYVVEGEGDAAPSAIAWMDERAGARTHSMVYVRRDRDAVAQLYRVAAGLDSMILGESQIQGQVRDAWDSSRAYAGPILNRLFQSALGVGTRVRSETAVGRGAASVSSAAVQLAKKIFGSLVGRRAMVLGAGEMAELALECLTSEGVRATIVANRTHDRAVTLAEAYGATAARYDDCWTRLPEVDVLLASTAAPVTIVQRAHIEPAMAMRGDRPLCILDIAIPRDVDASVRDLSNVFLYDLDDLQSVVATNLERRKAELPDAERLIAREVDHYWAWAAGLSAVPVLKSFREHVDGLREHEVEQAMRRLAHLSPEDRQAVEQLARSLTNKFLHEPSVRLRAAAVNGRGLAIVDALRYLFALDAPAETREPSRSTGDPSPPEE